MDRNDLLDKLSSCPPGIFRKVVSYLKLPAGTLSSEMSSQAKLASELIEWAEHDDRIDIDALENAYRRATSIFSVSRSSIGFLLLSSAVVTTLIMGVRWLGISQIEQLELAAFDQLIRSRQPEALDPRLLIVTITDQDLNNYGPYPLNDSVVVELIKRLQQHEPKVIGLDMHRNRLRGEGRQELISLFSKNKNLLTVCSFGSSNKNLNYAPPGEFTKQQKDEQVGFSDLFLDTNTNYIRRQLLSYNPEASPSPCNTSFSFSFKLAYRFLEMKGIKPLEPNHNNEWQLGKIVLKALTNRTGAYQNLGESDQILINYRSGKLAPILTATEVLKGKLDDSLIKGRVVLIGYSDTSSKDSFNTPYGEMSGVLIHAHMTSQIINAVMDERPLIWVLPQWNGIQWGDGLFILICSFTGGLMILFSKNSFFAIGTICIAIIVLYQLCFNSLYQGYWLPFLPSLLSMIATATCVLIREQFNFIRC